MSYGINIFMQQSDFENDRGSLVTTVGTGSLDMFGGGAS